MARRKSNTRSSKQRALRRESGKKPVSARQSHALERDKGVVRKSPEVTAENRADDKRWRRVLWFVLIGVVSTFFLILKMFTVYPYAGDEHIYIYQAQLIAEGFRPYADFAMAHPPVHALFTALVLKIAGYSLVLSRLMPIGWCLVGGILLGVLVLREYGSVASVTATALFLLAYEPLRASSHYTGVNMTVALLLAAVLAFRLGIIRIAAVMCVLAVYTRLYAGPGVLALVLFALVANPRKGLRLILYGGGIGIVGFVSLGLWTGFGDMVSNLILYHAQKTPMDPESLSGMRDKVLFHNGANAAIFVLAQVALIAYVVLGYGKARRESPLNPGPWQRLSRAIHEEKLGLVILADGIAILMLVVLLRMDRVWMYYFIPSFPFAALLGGWLVSKWSGSVVFHVRTRGKNLSEGLWRVVFGFVLLVLFVLSWTLSPVLEQRLRYYETEMRKPARDRVHNYEFKPGYLPEAVSGLVRRALWKDTRVIGETYNRFNYYLWHESRVLDILDDVVSIVKKETSTQGEIFGDSGTVPLFALAAKRRIVANQVDTNIQRFRSGAASPEELIRAIDTEKLEMIILRNRFGVAGLKQVQRLVREKYKRVKVLRTAQGRVFIIYKRRFDSERKSS